MNARFTHSMPDYLHESIKNLAKEKGKTVTTLINEVMADYSGLGASPEYVFELEKRIEALEKEVFKK